MAFGGKKIIAIIVIFIKNNKRSFVQTIRLREFFKRHFTKSNVTY